MRRARWLVSAGHAVHVVAVDRADSELGHARVTEDDVVEAIGVTRVSVHRSGGWGDSREYDDPDMYVTVSEAIERFRPDIVHLLSGHRITTAAVRAARDAGVPVILTAMDFWMLCPRVTLTRRTGERCEYPADPHVCVTCLANEWRRYRVPHGLTRGFTSKLLQRAWRSPTLRSSRVESIRRTVVERRHSIEAMLGVCDTVVVASHFVAAQLAGRVLDSVQLKVMRQGLDMQDWRPAGFVPRDSIHIGYIGQLSEHKGVFDLIRAFRQLSIARSGVRLFIHGDLNRAWPSVRKRLESMISGSNTISIAGPFDNRDIRRVHANLDVLVVPSRWYENSPNVILEAFACGTPVVAAELGGMAELVEHEVSGLLFPARDVAALGRCLLRLVDEPGLMPRLRAGIPAVKTIDEEMEELSEVYEDVIASAARGPR